MTTEETIRAAIAAYARRDLEGALSRCAEDIRFSNHTAPGTGMWEFDCRGIGAFRDALLGIAAEFDIEEYQLLQLVAQGPDAASRQHLRMKHRASGTVFETQIADFWRVEHGKITSILEFNDTAAVAALRGGRPHGGAT